MKDFLYRISSISVYLEALIRNLTDLESPNAYGFLKLEMIGLLQLDGSITNIVESIIVLERSMYFMKTPLFFPKSNG